MPHVIFGNAQFGGSRYSLGDVVNDEHVPALREQAPMLPANPIALDRSGGGYVYRSWGQRGVALTEHSSGLCGVMLNLTAQLEVLHWVALLSLDSPEAEVRLQLVGDTAQSGLAAGNVRGGDPVQHDSRNGVPGATVLVGGRCRVAPQKDGPVALQLYGNALGKARVLWLAVTQASR